MSSVQNAENKRLLCYKKVDPCDEIGHGDWPAVWNPPYFSVHGQTVLLELPNSEEATATVNGWPVLGRAVVVEPGDLARVRHAATSQGTYKETLLCIGRAIAGKRIKAGNESSIDDFTGLPIDEGIEAFGCSRCGSIYAPTTVARMNGRCANCRQQLTFDEAEDDHPDYLCDEWL